jgi:peptidylprolyl isomerase
MRKAFIVTALLMAAMWLTAQTGPQHPSPVDGAGITMPSGVAYWDLKMGTGAVAAKGSKVKVNYTGWLLEEGTTFDSSYDHGAPFEFTIGAGDVVKGWDLGVTGMKVGGKRQLRIPPDLAYGFRGQPPVIPRNAYLIFDVEVLDIK